MKSVVLAIVFHNVFQLVYTRIELENFYPYGPENGDTSVPTNDDGSSGRVNIGFRFPFFDEEHESLFVSIYIIPFLYRYRLTCIGIGFRAVFSGM
jgi:hypothetical protein